MFLVPLLSTLHAIHAIPEVDTGTTSCVRPATRTSTQKRC